MHTDTVHPVSFDAFLFTQIKVRRALNIHALQGANKLIYRLNECIARLFILMNSSVPLPFTCFQYRTRSKEVMIY